MGKPCAILATDNNPLESRPRGAKTPPSGKTGSVPSSGKLAGDRRRLGWSEVGPLAEYNSRMREVGSSHGPANRQDSHFHLGVRLSSARHPCALLQWKSRRPGLRSCVNHLQVLTMHYKTIPLFFLAASALAVAACWSSGGGSTPPAPPAPLYSSPQIGTMVWHTKKCPRSLFAQTSGACRSAWVGGLTT